MAPKSNDSSVQENVTKKAKQYNLETSLQKLRDANIKIEPDQFLLHAFGTGLLYSKEVNDLYYKLKDKHLGIIDTTDKTAPTPSKKKVLPQGFSFKEASNPNEHLANLRLSNHSVARTIGNPESILKDELIRNWKFGETDAEVVTEQQTILRKNQGGTRSRTDLVLRLGSYADIDKMIDDIKQNYSSVNDAKIAELVKENLSRFSPTAPIAIDQEVKDFVNAFTYLLFGPEVVRNPASLITHQMMLDLIIDAKKDDGTAAYCWKNFLAGESPLMPMAPKGATQAARVISFKLKSYVPWSYQYPGPGSDGKEAASNATSGRGNEGSGAKTSSQQLLKSEGNLLENWLKLKKYKQLESEKDRTIAIAKFLIEQIKSWYGVSLDHWLPDKKRDIDKIKETKESDSKKPKTEIKKPEADPILVGQSSVDKGQGN